MKFCTHCGTELNDAANFCSNCGRNVTTRTATVAPTQSSPAQGQENVSPALTLISFLLPWLGCLLYFLYKADQPAKAFECRRGALGGLAVGAIIWVLALIIIATS